jgi:hypothetical protein
LSFHNVLDKLVYFIDRDWFNNRARCYIQLIYRSIELKNNCLLIRDVAFCYNVLIQNAT